MRDAPSRLQVRLAADAASVPAVRRFVADGLTAWGEVRLVEAAELVASELSSNAALHAMAEFMLVTLERAADEPCRGDPRGHQAASARGRRCSAPCTMRRTSETLSVTIRHSASATLMFPLRAIVPSSQSTRPLQ